MYYYGKNPEANGQTILLKQEWVGDGEDGTPPQPGEVKGFTFAGWTGNSWLYTNVTSTRDIYAAYYTGSVTTYRVDVLGYDGRPLMNPQYIWDGGQPSLPYKPQREGYTYMGWDQEHYRIVKPATLRAKYIHGIHETKTVRFYGTMTGGRQLLLKEEYVLMGKNATPPKLPVYSGYGFQNWDGIYRGIQSDDNVFARYAQSPEPENRYKVGFWNANALLKLEHVMEGGDAAAPEAPRREGYEFTGWSPSCSNVKGDLMVTAQYRAKASKPDDRLERMTDALSRLDMPEDVRIGFINLAGVLIENETKPHARTGFLLFSLDELEAIWDLLQELLLYLEAWYADMGFIPWGEIEDIFWDILQLVTVGRVFHYLKQKTEEDGRKIEKEEDARSEGGGGALYDTNGNYTGGRTKAELDALADDPAHTGSKRPIDIEKGIHEREVGLGIEENGKIKGPITRDPSGKAEFFDADGQPWDVKSFNSNYKPKQGGFTLQSAMRSIKKSLAEGEFVILDTTNLNANDLAELLAELKKQGIIDKVILWP